MQSYTIVLALVLVAAVQGFAPVSQGRVGTNQLQASIFDAIQDMDLFAPKKGQNDYGARNKKEVSKNILLLFEEQFVSRSRTEQRLKNEEWSAYRNSSLGC